MDIQENAILTDVGGFRLNSVLISPKSLAVKTTVLFIHGASTSLLDPFYSFSDMCPQNIQMLFVDRPGHGKSDFGTSENILPDAQADAIATLMQLRGIAKAIIVGHSYGGAVAAALAVRHPEKVVGLIFLSPAAYPWVGGISWFNNIAKLPIIGALFSFFVVPTLGAIVLKRTTQAVFEPNEFPDDYTRRANTWQALRPRAFQRNARELAALSAWAEQASHNYKRIIAPTLIVTGDRDNIVSPVVHAKRLAKEIKQSELFVLKGMGHKSDYIAKDLVTAAIEKLSGQKIDLDPIARRIENKIAEDAKG